jgi:hypothetical protein
LNGKADLAKPHLGMLHCRLDLGLHLIKEA